MDKRYEPTNELNKRFDNSGAVMHAGISKVRRMARALEQNSNKEFRGTSATRETLTRTSPRSLDQLARFNSISDLHACQDIGLGSKKTDAPMVKFLGNSLLYAQNQSTKQYDKPIVSLEESSSNENLLSTLVPIQRTPCDVRNRPYVIIKETIPPQTRERPLMQGIRPADVRRNIQVKFKPAFEQADLNSPYISKYCNNSAAVDSRPLTFDHILLRSKSPPAVQRQYNPQQNVEQTDWRSGSADHVYSTINRKSAQDSCSSESGYLSDCSLLYHSRNNGTHCLVQADDKRCARDYSPCSTGSSSSAPSNHQVTKGQTFLFTQLSFDSALKSYHTSPAVSQMPGFARHTEASKRRSKKQSVSIPENLNSTNQKVNQRRAQPVERMVSSGDDTLTEQRSCQASKQATKSTDSVDLQKEWEPQGEYHVFKKWCDSLRKYEGKSKALHHFSRSSRRSLVEYGTSETDISKENRTSDKAGFPQSPLTQNVIYAFSDKSLQVGAISKAVSLDCVCTEAAKEPAQNHLPWNCERRFVIGRCSAAYNRSEGLSKFPMLDTVREENVNVISPTEKVVLRTRPNKSSPANPDHSTMNRYFSEANLSMQCQMLGAQATCSDILICKEQMPLRYKRESWLKRYGTEEAINCLSPLNKAVHLEPDADPPFERRNVVPRKDKRPVDEYTFGEFLGRGKFGEVKKCVEKKTKKQLAAKFVPVRSEMDRSNVYNEIEVMNSLQHPRLLQLYEAFDCGKELVLIMELISGGELFERVIDDDFILTEMLCELYVRQICEGIEFMHSQNFLHLDMKPENILCINRDGHRIKIIDFGLARKFKPGDSLRILFGTPEFVAPEVVSYEKIGQGTDLWSVGVICYVLLSGLSPFMGENDAETYNNINHVEYDFDDESFEEISDDAKDFISKLLVLKPEDRMTAEECLNHPWLTKHSNPQEPRADNVKINTKKLKRFVIRRRWQKAVNVLLALKRMGMSL